MLSPAHWKTPFERVSRGFRKAFSSVTGYLQNASGARGAYATQLANLGFFVPVWVIWIEFQIGRMGQDFDSILQQTEFAFWSNVRHGRTWAVRCIPKHSFFQGEGYYFEEPGLYNGQISNWVTPLSRWCAQQQTTPHTHSQLYSSGGKRLVQGIKNWEKIRTEAVHTVL